MQEVRNPLKSGLYKVAVTGVLVGPTDQPLINTNIRLTSEAGSSIPEGITMIAKVNAEGVYNFFLVAGTYKVELCIKREYTEIGHISIEKGDRGPFDLMTLLDKYAREAEDKEVMDSLAKSKEVLQGLVKELLMEDVFYQDINRITKQDIDTLFRS